MRDAHRDGSLLAVCDACRRAVPGPRIEPVNVVALRHAVDQGVAATGAAGLLQEYSYL